MRNDDGSESDRSTVDGGEDLSYRDAQAMAATGGTCYSFPTGPNIAPDDVVMVIVFPAPAAPYPEIDEVLSGRGEGWMTIMLMGRADALPDIIRMEEPDQLHEYRFHASAHPLLPIPQGTTSVVASQAMGLRSPGDAPMEPQGVMTAVRAQSAMSMKGHVGVPRREVALNRLYRKAMIFIMAVSALAAMMGLAGVMPVTAVTAISLLCTGLTAGTYPIVAHRTRGHLRRAEATSADMARQERVLSHFRLACIMMAVSSGGIMISGLARSAMA